MYIKKQRCLLMDSRQFMNKCAYWFAKGEKAVWHNYFWKGPTLLHDLKAILNAHHLHFLIEDPNDSPGKIIMKMWEMALVYIASTADSTHSTSVDTDRHLFGGWWRETTITVKRIIAVFPFIFAPRSLSFRLFFILLTNLASTHVLRPDSDLRGQ